MMFGQRLVSKPVDIATELNKFFIDKIKKLKQVSAYLGDPLENSKLFLINKNVIANQFGLKEIDEDQMLKLIKG